MEDLQITDDRLNIAVTAAEKAGDAALSVKHTTTQERKANDTIVTEADKEAETIVREVLTENSAYPILGEEQGGSVEQEDTYWVVDPIDGTHNFSYEQPIYGTAVALVENNEPTVGVFYMPELDYLFYAVDGEGAYRNTEQLSVTQDTAIENVQFALSGLGTKEFYDGVSNVSRWIQQLGSAVAAEGWIASGWTDVGILGALAPWDMAVGVILVRESGGVMKHIDTHSEQWNDLSDGKVILGSEPLVDSVLNTLSEETKQHILYSNYDY